MSRARVEVEFKMYRFCESDSKAAMIMFVSVYEDIIKDFTHIFKISKLTI